MGRPENKAPAAPEHAREPAEAEARELVRDRVAWPAGLWLRAGPGRAYHTLTALPAGTEVMGVDLAGMLREDRQQSEAAWLKVIAREGSGWVDSAFLERVC